MYTKARQSFQDRLRSLFSTGLFAHVLSRQILGRTRPCNVTIKKEKRKKKKEKGKKGTHA
jgi:hypothetical protein